MSGIHSKSSKTVINDGDADTGNVMLDISEGLASSLVDPSKTGTNKTINTPAVELNIQTFSPGSSNGSNVLSVRGINMAVNLEALAKDNNGSAAAAVLILSGMEGLLSDRFFKTENQTVMNSDIITAFLPKTNHSNFSQPVNFTIQHKKIGDPPPPNPFLEWLNRVGVIIGLFFFALAILTFLLCSFNAKINNTARLHLCITLALSHLLLLWNDRYTENKVACKVMAGLLHFLIVASFWWMFLEAMQLFTLVRRLSKVQVIQKDGLPTPVLYLIGYGAPFVTVGVSALVFSDGYGATDAEVCWLTTERSFNWALTGPVIALLGVSILLY
ncbi:hypothetical protein NHX12_031848 [Muraenolepis orangiensis]|uniref:G-protein coupled receptors family 2 profile 2 domain-containing protein n=2 Tax=Muraenolepis orangiensis TaxID=630683 RepID=A0A9Q0E4J7_9TELE|nr:hypothetical protein NHX12_031848 [Muraenolepis orangiensis]